MCPLPGPFCEAVRIRVPSVGHFCYLGMILIAEHINRHMDIPRSGNPFVMIAVLPALLIPVTHAKGADGPIDLVLYLGLMVILVALLLTYGVYMRKTPLVRIDETALTYFGNAKSQQRSFQRRAILSIRLFRRPDFWRSSYRLAVIEESGTVDLWIPCTSRDSISAVAQALREQFPGKFEEVLA